MIVPYAIVIISSHTVLGSLVCFFCDILSLKLTIVLIIGHFLTFVKFKKNSAAISKF